MQLRIKKTPYWGEVIGNSGTISKPKVLLKMKNGNELEFPLSELTDKTLFESLIIRLVKINTSLKRIKDALFNNI